MKWCGPNPPDKTGQTGSNGRKTILRQKEETKQLPLTCPHCRQEGTFPVRWIVRTKKAQVRGGANDQDRQQFAKARSYMVRVDNMVACPQHSLPQEV